MSLLKLNAGKTAIRPRVFAPLIVALILVGLGLALPVCALALRASDGGGWHVERASAGSNASLDSVTFIDANHGWAVGYDFGANGAIILATSDGGATWSAQDASSAGSSDASLDSVTFIDANHGWAVGSNGQGAIIMATTDGGATWSAQDSSSAGSTLSYLTSVAFADATHGWAVGSTYDAATDTWAPLILATSDGGATWDTQDPGPVQTLEGMIELNAVTFFSAERGWAVGDTGPAADEAPVILTTSDGGLTWKAERAGASRVYGGLYSVSFSDAEHGWAVGGVPGEQVGPSVILATHDGGANWHAEKAPHVDRYGTLRSVSFVNAERGWAVGYANRGFAHDSAVYAPVILATRNGGASWSAQDASGAGSHGYLIAITFVDAAHGWAVGDTGLAADEAPVVLATTNGGFLPRPTLTALKPATAKRGATVTITGQNFGAKRGLSTVKFGAMKCSRYLSWSATRIRCRVPAKAKLGRLKVTVRTTGGISDARILKVRR